MELKVQLLQSAVAAVAVAMMWQCQRLDATRCSSVTDASNCIGLKMQSLQSVALAVAALWQCQRCDVTHCSSVTNASDSRS